MADFLSRKQAKGDTRELFMLAECLESGCVARSGRAPLLPVAFATTGSTLGSGITG
jgi:hypothetical protein